MTKTTNKIINKIIKLQTPLDGATLSSLKLGDLVELSGEILTARDAAHKRIFDTLAQKKELPVDLNNRILFYAGPTPAKPGRVIGSIAPTTSARMDDFLEMTYQLGVSATIGKGERAPFVTELCKKYKRVYFLSFGGAAALISENVKKCRTLCYEDLGAESIKALEVEGLRLVVGIGTNGDE